MRFLGISSFILFAVLYLVSKPLFAQNITENDLLGRDFTADSIREINQLKYYHIVRENLDILERGEYSKRTKAKIYLSASNVFNGNTNYSKAIEYLLKAIKILDDLEDHESLIKAYNSLGGIYYNAYNYERCIFFTQKAILLAQNNNQSKELPILYNNLAGAYLKLDDFKSALEISKRALSYVKKYDADQMPIILGTIGQVYSAKKMYDSASFYINRALLLLKNSTIRSDLQESGLLLSLSQNQFHSGEHEAALASSLKTFKKGDEGNFILIKKDAAAILADLYEINNVADSMNYYRSIFIQLADSVYNLDKERQLSNVMIRARELELAEKEEEADRQRFILTSSLIIGTAFIILSILSLILYRRRNMLYEAIKIEKELIAEENLKLEEFNQTKDKVFSAVVHDFKTPLNSLESILSLLENDKLSQKEYHNLAASLKSKLLDSKRSINNLILWAKNQMSGIQPSFELLEIRKLIDRVMSYHELKISEKKLEVKLNIKPNLYFVTDEEILFIVLNNIISNAIKYSLENQPLNISITTENKNLQIVVEDFGKGIIEEDLNKLFENSKLSNKGTGLGLVLSKDLLEKINGVISVNSKPNKGASFKILIKSTADNHLKS